MSAQNQEAVYNELMKLYDFAEGVIDTIEVNDGYDTARKAELFIPIIEKMQEAADRITKVYLDYVKTGEKPSQAEIRKTETIVRRVYIELQKLIDKLDRK